MSVMIAVKILVVAILLTTAQASPFKMSSVFHPSRSSALSFLGGVDSSLKGSEYITNTRDRFIKALSLAVSDVRRISDVKVTQAATDYPYWRCIPEYKSLVTATVAQWSGHCWQNTQAALSLNKDGTYTITLTLSNPSSLLCSDYYLFATLEGVLTYTTPLMLIGGTATIQWTVAADASKSELWDIETNGIRAFLFLDDALTVDVLLAETVDLFAPMTTQDVSPASAEINLDFMAKYPQFKMLPRKTPEVALNESDIRSGDFFGIIRLDGLDPMLAWAMGATTGHTTMALWMEKELYVVESTTKGAYWPVDGVQRTPYATWIAQAKAADFQVVFAPLTDSARAQFNETAAAEFFNSVEGYAYGYNNLLWAWVDTLTQNYPCLPPDYKLCLTPTHVEMLFGFIDRSLAEIGDVLFLQAYNKRLGTNSLSFADMMMFANKSGIDKTTIPAMVEKDEWSYNTTRYGEVSMGPSMVCCVFVCRMWKAGGIFGKLTDEFQCAEQTNYDLYTLNVLAVPKTRPSQCTTADPNNQLCQLEGDYTLQLQDYSSRSAYANMDETCPSEAPSYKRPSNC